MLEKSKTMKTRENYNDTAALSRKNLTLIGTDFHHKNAETFDTQKREETLKLVIQRKIQIEDSETNPWKQISLRSHTIVFSPHFATLTTMEEQEKYRERISSEKENPDEKIEKTQMKSNQIWSNPPKESNPKTQLKQKNRKQTEIQCGCVDLVSKKMVRISCRGA